ncbi:MAG TPA: O-antigen polysaccharide polymerase Wzy [Steroidobacteraceae bacterium]
MRFALYAGLNILFWLLLAVGYAVGGQADPRILYLVALFALCSSAVIDLDGLNGRYSFLAIFLVLYFVYFGVQDVSSLFDGSYGGGSQEVLSKTEALILVGGMMLVLGFRVAVKFRNPPGKTLPAADWPLRSILVVGTAMWLIGTAATYYWYFFIVTDKTLAGTKAISSVSQWVVSGLILGQMLVPLSTLLLAYAWRSTRRGSIFALVAMVVAVQFFLGFVIDIKVMALTGGLLVILTIVLTEGRIPKAWIAGVAIFIYAAFPVFQAYRAVVTGNVSRVAVLENFSKTLDAVLAAETRTNSGRERAQTFFERLSMKSSVQMIVHGTESGIPFQHGYTLTPIISSFLPRIVWTDKPDVPVGRMINRAFNVTEQDETYISPSHLGELYWNFGWPGVVLGMAAIGALSGFISRFNLRERKTVTRLLVMALSVEFVIHGFEGSIATSYVVWLRTMAAVGLLHLLFARKSAATATATESAPQTWPPEARFTNLLT